MKETGRLAKSDLRCTNPATPTVPRSAHAGYRLIELYVIHLGEMRSMETMYALVYRGPGSIRLETMPKPKVGLGDILVKVRAAAVCASDIRVFKGEKKAEPGVIQGHEFSGDIETVGEDVQDYRIGERVTLHPVISCGRCFYCLKGHVNMCLNRKTIGYDENGGFAEYILIPASMVESGSLIRVPSPVSYDQAALAEPLGCAVNSIETCRLHVGASLLIVGAGPMGLMNLLVGRVSGAGKIIVSEPIEERLKLAGRIGADVLINPREEDLLSRVAEETGGLGVDAAIVTIGIPQVIAETLKTTRKLGVINLFAGCPPGSEMKIDPNPIHYKELLVTGSQNATITQFRHGLELLENRKVDLECLITHRFPLKRGEEAFQKRIDLEGLKPILLPQSK
ncbi:alcohol dehydrogenase catalytic domain-containing protein [Candidatus Bathyarchaeota archaeon]|nr:alcohol dehydrogenase catalytic domain-containing protein [Candidatus Bathyarchaeota archaeon]